MSADPIQISDHLELLFETPGDAQYFFGYFDKPSMSADNSKLLAHKVDFKSRAIRAEDVCTVGYFDLVSGAWNSLAQTQALNWQQGSQLQWMGPDYHQKIIFNTREEDHYAARIQDIQTGESVLLKDPIYALLPEGKQALGVNFERHAFCRAYHYEGIRNEVYNQPVHEDDGIYLIDLETKKRNLVIATSLMARYRLPYRAQGLPHWLEHVQPNPSGSHFLFYHRFGKGERFVTRLCSARLDGSDLHVYPSMVNYTHACWLSDTEICVWAQPRKTIKDVYTFELNKQNRLALGVSKVLQGFKARRQRVPQGASPRVLEPLPRVGNYFTYHLGSDARGCLIGEAHLPDGHPTSFGDGRMIITDTYQDQDSQRHLYVLDRKRMQRVWLGSVYSSLNDTPWRCDLHPRVSRDGKFLSIDSSHQDYRSMLVFKINWQTIDPSL